MSLHEMANKSIQTNLKEVLSGTKMKRTTEVLNEIRNVTKIHPA